MRNALCWLAIALTSPTRASADACRLQEDRLGWYTPDYVELQTGGNQGLMTIGGGYLLFDSRLDLGAQYGWVPERLGGNALHSLSLTAYGRARGMCIRPTVSWSYIYGGFSLLFPLGGDGFYFLRVPDRYHDAWYYRKTALRMLLTVGTQLDFAASLGSHRVAHGVFWEISALDQYLVMWAQSGAELSLAFPWSSALGYRLRF